MKSLKSFCTIFHILLLTQHCYSSHNQSAEDEFDHLIAELQFKTKFLSGLNNNPYQNQSLRKSSTSHELLRATSSQGQTSTETSVFVQPEGSLFPMEVSGEELAAFIELSKSFRDPITNPTTRQFHSVIPTAHQSSTSEYLGEMEE